MCLMRRWLASMSCTFSGQSTDTACQNVSSACLLGCTATDGSDIAGWYKSHKSLKYCPNCEICLGFNG